MPVCNCRHMCGNCDKCYPLSFASHPKAVFWSDQNGIKPRLVFKGSNIKFWFDCSCNHSFLANPKSICRGSWCPYCSVSARLLCGDKTCLACWDRSLASHPLADMYSLQNEVEAHQVLLKSNQTFQFDCPTCKHSFEAMAYNIAAGKGCPFCASPSRKLCTDVECHFCFDRSFASHPRAADWSEENSRKPRDVMRCCNDAFKFDCKLCHHTFQGKPNAMTQGVDCSFCCIPAKQMCLQENCQHCFKRSFASHPMSGHWCPTNAVKPREVFLGSHISYFFVCPECQYRFCAAVCDVARGRFCGVCKSKTEKMLKLWFDKVLPETSCSMQTAFSWCILESGQKARYDFTFEKLKLIVELQGKAITVVCFFPLQTDPFCAS